MPDLGRCIKRDGKLYCWDFEQRKIVEIVLRDVPLTPETMDIIGDIINLAASTADNTVPDLSRPRYVDGRLYCWDRANKEIVEIQIVPVDFTGCDRRVLAAFVEDGGSLATCCNCGFLRHLVPKNHDLWAVLGVC
jgi:hypothetical protein